MIGTEAVALMDDGLKPVGCATCGGSGFVSSTVGPGFSSCKSCGGAGCTPGHKACYPIEAHTFVGRFLGNLYQCLCCPDPCYEPRWVPAANAAFFVDYARPRTVQRIRYDRGWNMQFPDRSEYFWARESLSGPIFPNQPNSPKYVGGGSGPPPPKHPPKVRYAGVPSLNFNQLYYYQEAASGGGRASIFTEVAYRTVSPVDNYWHAGFNNINVGTKGMFLDCELVQLTFQFTTYIPLGPASKGLSNGHVSLEPALLGALRLSPETYLQAQLAEWIPIGGDTNYQGSILHYHFSLNQVLFKINPDIPIIGTCEFSGWSFQDGAYTDPSLRFPQFQRSSGSSYLMIGPGLRTSICNRVDFGGAVAFPITDNHWADPLVRIELRILF